MLGNTSHSEEVLPASTVASAGIYLFGEIVDGKDLNIGPPALFVKGGIIATSLSICSQLYVKAEVPFASVALPFKIKGVDFGML